MPKTVRISSKCTSTAVLRFQSDPKRCCYSIPLHSTKDSPVSQHASFFLPPSPDHTLLAELYSQINPDTRQINNGYETFSITAIA